jgi:histidine triad (HIT) family protein
VLVIPKQHATNIYEIDPDALAAVSRATQKLAYGIRAALDPDGVMVMQLNGAAAGQTVFHYHSHLIPRSEGSSLTLQPRIEAPDSGLAACAERLRAALD